jgi:hypothetical protein
MRIGGKKMGDPCCPFWRHTGECTGWPGDGGHECTANEDGTHCLLFPQTMEEHAEARAIRLKELQREKE